MPLALKFKSISSEQCEPEQNERSEAECWQKKITDQKESNCWNLSIHVKTN